MPSALGSGRYRALSRHRAEHVSKPVGLLERPMAKESRSGPTAAGFLLDRSQSGEHHPYRVAGPCGGEGQRLPVRGQRSQQPVSGRSRGVNARLFEAATSVAAALSEYRPVLPDLFAIGEEMLGFRDFDELVERASRLLAEPGLTAGLGDAAARRTHRHHTIGHGLATIIKKVT